MVCWRTYRRQQLQKYDCTGQEGAKLITFKYLEAQTEEKAPGYEEDGKKMYPVLRRFRQTQRERFRSYLRDPGMTNGLETVLVKRTTRKMLNGARMRRARGGERKRGKEKESNKKEG